MAQVNWTIETSRDENGGFVHSITEMHGGEFHIYEDVDNSAGLLAKHTGGIITLNINSLTCDGETEIASYMNSDPMKHALDIIGVWGAVRKFARGKPAIKLIHNHNYDDKYGFFVAHVVFIGHETEMVGLRDAVNNVMSIVTKAGQEVGQESRDSFMPEFLADWYTGLLYAADLTGDGNFIPLNHIKETTE